MTKYEWERRLKKCLRDLPSIEQDKVFDYYDELFADKIECGMREEDIIDEFGSPYEVADRIRNENRFGFDDDFYEEKPPYKNDFVSEERERKERLKREERERRENRAREERERREFRAREERERRERRAEEERARRERRSRERRERMEERAERERERRERRFDDYYDERPGHIHKRYEWHPTVAGALLGVLLIVFVFIPVCAVTFGLFIASVGIQIAGVVMLIYSFFGFAFASAQWLCVFGGSIAAVGAGQLIFWAGRTVYKLFKIVIKWLFGYTKCKGARI